MRKEKIVKKQAREALKGNTLPIIAGILLNAVIFILLQNAMYLFWLMFGAINLETERMQAGSEIPYFLTLAGVVTVGVFLSPFFNGMFKAGSNAVIENENSITDLFCFFRGGRRYLKTLLVNMVLFLIFGTLTTLFQNLLFSVMGTSGLMGVLAGIISGIFEFLIYAWFVHYPLCLYAIDDSKSFARYAFGYIGFSLRHFGSFIKLVFSMLGWILLCFFVVTILYVGPYALCAAINSTRWLKKLDDEAKQKYAPMPEFTGYTEQFR